MGHHGRRHESAPTARAPQHAQNGARGAAGAEGVELIEARRSAGGAGAVAAAAVCSAEPHWQHLRVFVRRQSRCGRLHAPTLDPVESGLPGPDRRGSCASAGEAVDMVFSLASELLTPGLIPVTRVDGCRPRTGRRGGHIIAELVPVYSNRQYFGCNDATQRVCI